MNCFLDREDQESLPQQITRLLRQRILAGEFQPGKKLPAVRRLAAEMTVSPVTLIKALDILEADGSIVRIARKGIFVSKNFNLKSRPLTACVIFPEEKINLIASEESNALLLELYRGLMQGAVYENIRLQFSYLPYTAPPAKLAEQLKELEVFDFVIFSTPHFQHMRSDLCDKLPVFCAKSNLSDDIPPGVHVSSYDRVDAREKLFKLFSETLCRSAAAIASVNTNPRAADFLQRVAESGKITPPEGVWAINTWYDFNAATATEQLENLLKKQKCDFIFCHSTDLVSCVYEAIHNLGFEIGRDIMVAGIATGVTVNNLFPRFTYFKIPRFEQGIDIMHAASESIRLGKPVELPMRKVSLVAGKSVVLPGMETFTETTKSQSQTTFIK